MRQPASTTARVSTAGGYVWSGTTRTVTATVRRADNGTAVAWSPVVVQTLRSGRVVASENAFTNGAGVVSLRKAVSLTTTYRVVYRGSVVLAGSTSNAVTFTAMPKTSVRYSRTTVSVSVYPAAKQKVYVQRLVKGKWSTVRSGTVNSRGAITLTKVPTGTLRVYISKAPNLDSVTSAAWTTR